MKRSRRKTEAPKRLHHTIGWSDPRTAPPDEVIERAMEIFETDNVRDGESVTISHGRRDYVFGPGVAGTMRSAGQPEVEIAIHMGQSRPTKQREPYAWVWFMPRIVREAFVRELLDERDAMRNAGKGRIFIASAIASQIAIFVAIGGKEALKSFVRRVIGLGQSPSDVS